MTEMQQQFERIEKLTEDALKKAKGHVDDAINWGDLHCCSVEFYQDNHGDSGYRVHIEEASPSASALQMFVYEELKKHGITVDVHTEW